MKTPEEKMATIMAYCTEVCPNTSTGYSDLKDISLMRMDADKKEWRFTAFGCPRFFIHATMPDADINSAYSYLGLEARDERERAAKLFKAIEAVTHGRGDLEAGMKAIRDMASQAIANIEKGEVGA